MLASVPGYDGAPPPDKYMKAVIETGGAISGPTAELAPADRKIFKVRDVTATVESVALITGSIMSKKLATGAERRRDLRRLGHRRLHADGRSRPRTGGEHGRGRGRRRHPQRHAPHRSQRRARHLGRQRRRDAWRRSISSPASTRTRGRRSSSIEVTADMIRIAGVAPDMAAARALAEARLADGSAAARFGRMIAALGGPADFVERPEHYLPKAAVVAPGLPGGRRLRRGDERQGRRPRPHRARRRPEAPRRPDRPRRRLHRFLPGRRRGSAPTSRSASSTPATTPSGRMRPPASAPRSPSPHAPPPPLGPIVIERIERRCRA